VNKQQKATPAIDAGTAKGDEQIGPGPSTVSGVRRLDVDAVLARALPECEASLAPLQKMRFPWRRRNPLTARRATNNSAEVGVPDSPRVV
jgi:hypothetical protein